MISLLLCFLSSAALFIVDDLSIWFFHSVPTALEATQEALILLERWSKYWCLPLSLSKCEASFLVNPHQANLQPNLLLFSSLLRFNPTPTFLGVTFDCTLFFSRHVSSLKANFFASLTALRCISASSWGSSKESLYLFCIKLLFGPLSLMFHPDCFLS